MTPIIQFFKVLLEMEESPTSKTLGNYFFILGSHAISLFGSSLMSFVIIWWITTTTSSGFFISLILIWSFLTQGIVTLFAGVFSDVTNRKIILITSNIVRLSTTIGLIYLIAFGIPDIIIFFLISIIRNIADAFYQPTFFTIAPSMVNQKQLGRINGFTYFLGLLPQMFAPFCGAYLLTNFSLIRSLLVMLIIIGITLGPFFLIKIPKTKDFRVKVEKNRERLSIIVYFKNFVEGFRTLGSIPGIIILMVSILILGIFPFDMILSFFLMEVHGGSPLFLSFISMASFFGVFIGIHIFVIRKYWNPVLIFFFLSMALTFLADLLFFLAPYRAFGLIFFTHFIKSFLLVFSSTILYTIIQSNVPNNRLGRVSSIFFSFSSFIGLIAPIPFSFLIEISPNIRLTLSLLALIGIVSIAVLYIISRMVKRKYTNYKVENNIESHIRDMG
jgi:DHA3 family macrolide efflux protein-like MFS transporter